MSHFTSVETQITNLAMLKKALEDLGYKTVEEKNNVPVKINGWNNEKMDAQMGITTGTPYGIGVVWSESRKSYEFVADWWGIETYTEEKQETIINKITQKYAYHTVLDKVKDKGYTVVEEKSKENKEIHLVLRKWR